MGFFDKFFDKREKYDYMKGSDYLFNMVLMQKDQYTSSFDDVNYDIYRSELIGIVAAYLDRDPKIKTFDCYRSFGECILYYGTVHASREIRESFLPLCKKSHEYYKRFFNEAIGQVVSTSATQKIANDIISRYNIPSDTARVNAIIVDISKMIEIVDAVISTYRFVN
jgi:hypothetical protein